MARILIVDDEAIERNALRFFVTGADLPAPIDVDEAANGREACSLARRGDYDVIFMDIRMPGMDGLSAAEALRAEGIETPIVLVSAFDEFEYARQALRAGVHEYLLKPASREEVLSALARSLASREQTRIRTRREEDSRQAIVSAVEKIVRNIESRMCSGLFDPLLFANFERLSSLEGSQRAAFAFSFPGSAAGDHAMLSLALAAAGEVLKDYEPRCAALGPDYSILLIYGRQGIAKLRDLAADISRTVLDRVPACLLCGLAGPSREDSTLLLSRALEAVRLATLSVPVVAFPGTPSGDEGKGVRNLEPNRGEEPRSLGNRALVLMSSQYSSNLSLSSVAESLGASSFHLSHVLSKEFGMGFSTMLARIRINRAKELLSGGASAKETAFLVGFSDQAYFTRVFKRIEGCSPREFLQKKASPSIPHSPPVR